MGGEPLSKLEYVLFYMPQGYICIIYEHDLMMNMISCANCGVNVKLVPKIIA